MAYDEPVSDEQSPDIEKNADRVKKKFAGWDEECAHGWAKWRLETRLSYDMISGKQWDDDAAAQLEEDGIQPINWNRIDPLVDAVSGAQIANRHELKFYPREMGDVGVSELLTRTAEWVADEGEFATEETDAFKDALICGLGWTETRMDYDDNPRGEIRKDRIDPLEMTPDPNAKKRNLTDATYIRRVKAFTLEEFRDKWPEWADEIGDGMQADPEDFMTKSRGHAGDDYDYDDPYTEKEYDQDIIHVKEYQWRERVAIHRLVDPFSGELAELTDDEFDTLDKRLQPVGIVLDSLRQKKWRYYRAFCAGDNILGGIQDLPDNRFTWHCITGKRDRNANVWYGLVRAMVDPQRWYNKWMTQIQVIMAKNAKGGVMIEEDAIDDLREFEDEWARPDSVHVLKSGALLQQKVKEKQGIQYPSGLDRLIQMAAQSIREVSGISQEFLGLTEQNQPGIVEHQRREAGYTMLAVFFDSLRRYRRLNGELVLAYIQKYISDERLIRVLGEDGTAKFIPLMREETAGDYDVILDEAPSGPNQKEKVWSMLVQMLPMLMRVQLPPEVWAEFIKYSPLPESVAQKVVGLITKPPDPQAMQAQQEMMAMRKAGMQAELAKTQSETAENTADAQKTIAGAAKLKAETENQALETMLTQALLSRPIVPQVRINT